MHLLTKLPVPMTTTDASALLLLSRSNPLLLSLSPDCKQLLSLSDSNRLLSSAPIDSFARSNSEQYFFPNLRKVLNQSQNGASFFVGPDEDEPISFGTPVLTNVVTKKGMAIIKVDHDAIMMLRQLSCQRNQLCNKDFSGPVQFKHASTEPFSLTLDDDVINVAFKLYVDGCSSDPGEAGRFVSIFLEMAPQDPNMTLRPVLVTLFLKNLKDGNTGSSYKRSFKIQDASGGFPVERGLREFVNMTDFDRCLENEKNGGCLSFGVMVQPL